MKPVRLLLLCLAAPLVSCLFTPLARADEPDKQGIEIDARGPVHEAYARPWQANPQPNQAVDKKPPEPIPEEPAAEKPAGKNVQWIPGYWQYDTDRKDFIWVSGIWRDLPAGRRWVMGYWTQTPEGYRWVSGHFAAAQEKDYQYVPEPPQNPDDRGPATPAPDASSSYIPGSWVYGDDGYTYRDGYWTEAYDDQVWVPASYYWTPYGYGYSSGYWDYPLGLRGLLFAPAYFTRPLWLTPGWYYRPWLGVGFGGLFDNFFVGLGWGHYFFGDYYGRGYLGRGIYPWFWNSGRHFDPLWAHNRWANRGNANWAAGMRNNYIGRVNGTMTAPARTFAGAAGGPQMLHTFSQLSAAGQHLSPVTGPQRTAQLQSARQMVSQAQHLSQGAPRTSASFGGQFNGLSRSFSPGFSSAAHGQVQHSFSPSNRSFSSPGSATFNGGAGIMQGHFAPPSGGSFQHSFSGGSHGGFSPSFGGGFHGGGGGFPGGGGGGSHGGGGGHGGGHR